jgi:hypothetical protein
VGLFVWIAKGWQISSGRPRDPRLVGEVLLLYLTCSIAVYWWSFHLDDALYVLYVFQVQPTAQTLICPLSHL